MSRSDWRRAAIRLVLFLCLAFFFVEPVAAAEGILTTNDGAGTSGATSAPPGPSQDDLNRAEMELIAGRLGTVMGLIVSLIILFKLFAWIYRLIVPKKPTAAQVPVEPAAASGAMPSPVAKNAKRPNQCNVVSVRAGQRKLWRFAISGRGKASLTQEFTELPEENLPAKVVGKSWGDLWNPKLNVAWLPSDKVFLRVAEFPASNPEELLSMVELQLEKLSPLPLSQIAWAIEPLPVPAAGLGTMLPVVLIIASRFEVEKQLGQLEQTGYLADRLELPELRQLLAAHKPDDGIWFLPRGVEDNASVLIAWWYGGTLKNLTIANLTEPSRWEIELGDQLSQVAWSGELEGWYLGEPHFHLLADIAAADTWKPVLEKVTGEPVTVDEPVGPGALAGLGAQEAATGAKGANLMPPDILERYRQRFIDSIWMRGLGTVVMLYLFGILLYFGALEFFKYQRNDLRGQVHELSGPYTNALLAKARVDVLQEQIALKFAALESLRAISAELPEGMILTSFDFSKGRKITLRGTVANEDISNVSKFHKDLSRLSVDGETLFKNVSPPAMGGRSGSMSWSFTAELNSAEI